MRYVVPADDKENIVAKIIWRNAKHTDIKNLRWTIRSREYGNVKERKKRIC
jgi:hypothetical protein